MRSSKSGNEIDGLEPGEHTAIVGGGPAGLTAAYLLSKGGHDATVFESEERVGGISKTEMYEGYRFDIGGHRFFTKIQAVEDLWNEILPDDFISVPRLSRIRYEGTFFHYPLKPANALFGLGVRNSVGIGLSYLYWHLFPYPREDNFEQWVTNRFGKRLYEIFFKTYTEKVWGIPCTEIRAEWAAQRIKGLSLARALLSAVPLNRRPGAIKSLIEEFRYPRLGPGQMWETCAKRVEEMGNHVRTGTRVEEVRCRDGRVAEVAVRSRSGETTVLSCDHLVSTMPLSTLVHSLQPAVPEETLRAAKALRYRDFIVVALILEGEDLFDDNWIYVHTPGIRVGRVQNFNNWSRDLVPEEGRTCLGLEYFCFEGDGLWTADDGELIARAEADLRALDLAGDAPVVDGTVLRMPKAYPVYDEHYPEAVATIRSHLQSIPNLQTVGRNGLHKYNNQDHSMLTAMMAVRNLEGASHDVWQVNSDFEYLEEQRLPPKRTEDGVSAGDREPMDAGDGAGLEGGRSADEADHEEAIAAGAPEQER